MPRKRKFNVPRHPNGKPKLVKAKDKKPKDSGSEYLLAQRARAFGWKNITDPRTSDADAIGNIKVTGHIDEEQYRALSRLQSLFDKHRNIRSTLWGAWQRASPIDHVSPHPQQHPKTMSLDGRRGGQSGEPNIDRLCEVYADLSDELAIITKNVPDSIYQLTAYGELTTGMFSFFQAEFYRGVSWLVEHFQKETGRKAY
jgi:hypothetical protein